MKVSVIVPAYNSEKWIRRCVESITDQNYTNLEIIVLNDGSKDNTLKILKTLAEGDDRLRVIDKENTGTYLTRRRGVFEASGEAIVHVDSDDFLPLNAIRIMAEKMVLTQADIVVGDHYKIIGKKKQLITNKITSKSDRKKLMKGILDNDIKGYLWGKIYRTELMRTMELIEDTILFEDLYTNLQLFARNHLYVEQVKIPVYNYYIHNHNSTSTRNSNLIESVFEININTEELLKTEGFLPELNNEFSAFKCRNWIVYSRMGGVLSYDKSFRKKFYRNNFQAYAQKHMAAYHKLEMILYTHHVGMGQLLTRCMKGIQKVLS